MAAVLIIAGTLLVSTGVALIYMPGGLIVAGVLALWFGIDAARDVLPGGESEEQRGEGRLRAVGDGS